MPQQVAFGKAVESEIYGDENRYIFTAYVHFFIVLKLCSLHFSRAFSGGRTIAHVHTGTRPSVRLGVIDRAPSNRTFPLNRAMSHSGAHTGELCRQMIFVLIHTL